MNKLVLLLVFLLGLGTTVVAQEMTLDPAQYVNLQILADTVAGGAQAHDVYKVESGNIYGFDGTLNVNFDLVIEGPDNGWIGKDATPPVFLQTPSTGGSPRDMFEIRAGGSITLKNILLTGLHSNDENISSFILSTAGDSIITDNCVFSDHKDHAFKVTGEAQKVSVTNCIFLNGVRKSASPWGGMNIRIDANISDVLLENNTSVNSSRLLGNGGNFFDTNIKEIHCTYLNMQVNAHETHYSEALQANNIFYNWGFRGRVESTINYEAYFTPWDWFGDVENNLESISLYHAKNLLFLDPAFIDYYANDMAAAGVMPCLLWNNGIDSTINADDNFTIGKNYWQFDPEFTTPPDNLDEMLAWVAYYWNSAGDWPDWRVPLPVTFDGGVPVLNWPPAFDLSYPRPYLQTAGTDGLPLGDLNWFPDAKATYLANRDTYIAALQDSIVNATDVYDPSDSESATITEDMVSVEDFISGPSEFNLYQNYPNPFNPTTQIAFKIDKANKISMKIYDIAGQLVKTVIDNKNYTAGAHVVTIDMADNSSGVYFTVLNNGNKKLVRKMMLIK
jgi:hypothetical protein